MSNIAQIGLLATVLVLSTLGILQVRRDRSPASPGDPDGREVRMPPTPVQQLATQRRLQVDSFQVQRIASGSDLGAAGELLITFIGQGFLLTARAPRVHIVEGLVLDVTEVNRDGTELYVVLPRAVMSRVEAARFDSVVVANPGGREDTEFARAPVRATAAQLLRPDPRAPAVRVVYRDGAFSREMVRQ